MSTAVDNVWIRQDRGSKFVEKGDCRCRAARHILWLSRRGSQQHQRLHQWSGGGSFGTFPCPSDMARRANRAGFRRPSLALQVALKAPDDLGGLVVGPVARLGSGTRECPELTITGVTQSG